jgi:hypothetical protein
VEFTMHLVYRQTYNMQSGRWVVPKKLEGKKWIPIKNVESVTSKRWGYNGAILRMKKVFDVKRDKEGKAIWSTKTSKQFYPTKNPKYLIVFLNCYRRGYGFSRSL